MMEITEGQGKAISTNAKDMLPQEEERLSGLVPLGQTLDGVFCRLDYYAQQPYRITLPSGYYALDDLTAGFNGHELVVVAGRPCTTKTTFCLNVVKLNAVDLNTPVAIFSLQNSAESIVNRLLSIMTGIDRNQIRTGRLEPVDRQKLDDAKAQLASAPIYIDDIAQQSLKQIEQKCSQLHMVKGKLGLIVIDDIQGLTDVRLMAEKRCSLGDAIAERLRCIARKYFLPVIVVSEVSRGVEDRSDSRPLLGDISPGITPERCDLVLLLYRDELYNRKTLAQGIVEVHVAKQKDGPTGIVQLNFLPQSLRLESHF